MEKDCCNCKYELYEACEIPCIDCGMDDRKHWKPKSQTNADRIRAMSDEELAETFHAVMLGWAEWCDHHCANQGEDGYDNCIKQWLQQPAED